VSPTDGQLWVDTDGTALINQLLRWSKATANGTTTLSGNDDNSVPLTYSVGYEQVFQNGALLARGGDYTATNGTTISLTNASVTGDIFEVFAAQPVAISDVYTQTQANAAFINDSLLTATGDIIYASGANTPARLGVGSSGQVLSVSGGVPTWATASAGGMTLLATVTAAAATSVSFTSISGSYKHLLLVWERVYSSVNDTAYWTIRCNNNQAGNHSWIGSTNTSLSAGASAIDSFGNAANDAPILGGINTEDPVYNCFGAMWLYDYSDAARGTTVEWKSYNQTSGAVLRISNCVGNFGLAAAITRIDFIRNSTQTVTGTFRLYGVS
jgi:hypothetical protein